MYRRTVLARLGTAGIPAVSGCAGVVEPPRRGYSGLQRRVHLVGQDTLSADLAVTIEATLLDPTVTGRRTAHLQLTTTNHGPPRALSVGTGGCVLLNRRRGGSDEPPGLWLYTVAESVRIDREGHKWVATSPRLFFAYGCFPTVYARGDTVTNTYALWQDPEYSGYLDPGTYRWAEPVKIWADRAHGGDDPDETVTWGFSLGIEKPEETRRMRSAGVE